jgi:hypothetical protein
LKLGFSPCSNHLKRENILPNEIAGGAINRHECRKLGTKALLQVGGPHTSLFDGNFAMRWRGNKADNRQRRSSAIFVYARENPNIDIGVWLCLVLTLNRLLTRLLTESGHGQSEQNTT